MGLCKGFTRQDKVELSYKKSEVDRIVKDKFISLGNISKTTERGPLSIYGGWFNDESFQIKHSEPGLLAMSHHMGKANSNECQFYITTSGPLSFMDNKSVVFGRVIDGMETIYEIENQEFNKYN